MKIKLLIILVIVAVAATGSYVYAHGQPEKKAAVAVPVQKPVVETPKPVAKPKPKPKPKPVVKAVVAAPVVRKGCAGNQLSKFVLIDISDRHMWGCQASKQVYSTAIITGMDFLAADLTPRGTFYISSKQTKLYLKGSDSTGSWNDYVYYWMPFLNNQYGTYGFHDATWRKDSEFGNVSPNSKDASHGCVELPLAAAKWLYNWAPVGTPLTIQS